MNAQLKMVSVGDAAEIRSGYAFKSDDYRNEGIRLVRIGNLNGNGLEFSDEAVCVPKQYEKTYSDFLLNEGDVLIAMSGATTGKLAFVKEQDLPCILNQRVGRFSVNPKVLDSKFLFNYLSQESVRRKILSDAGGSAQPNVSPSQLKELRIPLPPLPIQKRIAAILEKADAAREKSRQTSELTEKFLQSAFLEMFGDPVTNPKGWEVGRIEDVITSIVNDNPSKQPNKEYQYIDIASIDNKVKKIIAMQTLFGKHAPSRARQLVKKNDVLVSTVRPNLNAVAIVTDESQNLIASTGYCVLRAIKVVPVFLFQLTKQQSFVDTLSKQAKGASYPAVNDGQIKNIKIPLPPLSLQQKFAALVEKAEAMRTKQHTSEQELENLFQSLMQRAFKGELVS